MQYRLKSGLLWLDGPSGTSSGAQTSVEVGGLEEIDKDYVFQASVYGVITRSDPPSQPKVETKAAQFYNQGQHANYDAVCHDNSSARDHRVTYTYSVDPEGNDYGLRKVIWQARQGAHVDTGVHSPPVRATAIGARATGG